MKKIILALSLFILSPAVLAWDFCLNIECPDCTSYSPQQLRVDYDADTKTFSGIVQALDNSWGMPTLGTVSGTHIYFARYNGSKYQQYFYDIDLANFTGTRNSSRYHYINDVPYSKRNTLSHALSLSKCN